MDSYEQAAEIRRDELERLCRIPPGALWTRKTFELEYGSPIHVGTPTLEVLGPDADEQDCCPHCEGGRFRREVYATYRPGVRVAFWWCQGCGLGRPVAWGALRHLDNDRHAQLHQAM
jgi:hypothetical protein